MIASVPHSGTRSLMKHLDQDAYFHFGRDQTQIEKYRGHVDVPIRNPYDVAESWDARYPTEEGKGPEEMLRAMDLMLSFIVEYGDVGVWKIEDLDIREGKHDKFKHIYAGTHNESRIECLKHWLNGDRLYFYQQYYPGIV